MAKKLIISIAILLGVLFLLLFIARATGIIQFYSVPSESNAPTFNPGSYFFASRLKAPSRKDFIAYSHTDEQFGKQVWFHRLIGMPGDIVEIRKGKAFVNGLFIDQGLNLMREYTVHSKAAMAFPDELSEEKLSYRNILNSVDTSVYMLSDKVVKEKNIPAALLILPADKLDSMIQSMYHAPWNADNFGPVKVPAGHYFLLGDNRHNAMDSRYTGFISSQDFVGTVFGKF